MRVGEGRSGGSHEGAFGRLWRSRAATCGDYTARMVTTAPAELLGPLLADIAAREAADPERYPVETVAQLIAARLHAAPFAPVHGGLGWSLREAVGAVELLSEASPSAGLLLAMPMGLAGVHAIDVDVAPVEHRARWAMAMEALAKEYAAGRWYAACNSEKGAGGSLDATKTVARLDARGRFCLSGEKILASGGTFADVFFSTAKVSQEDLPGAGVVEFFFLPVKGEGTSVLADWDGFGMRSTESHTVRYESAPAAGLMGFPNFIATVQPLSYWFCLFAAIPLGCAAGILRTLGTPAPTSPALRLRLSDAVMRYESLRAYLLETATGWRAAGGPALAARVLRTKTFVTSEATKLCAELFSLAGGRHYRSRDPLARALSASFAGTALRPPLALALDTLVDQFSLGELQPGP